MQIAVYDAPDWSASWPLFGVGLLGIGALVWLAHCDAGNEQQDLCASALMDSLSGGRAGEFVLYLRPFRADGRMEVIHGSLYETLNQFFLIGIPMLGGLEARLVRAASRARVRILQIGLPVAPMSLPSLRHFMFRLRSRVGTFYASDRWKQDFARLAAAARVCVIVPPDRVSRDGESGCETEWELDELVRTGRISKTILIMPGFPIRTMWQTATDSKARALWQNTLHVVAGRINLPRYVHGGAMVVNTTSGFRAARGLDGRRWDSIYAITRMLQGGQLTAAPLLDALRMSAYAGFVTAGGFVMAPIGWIMLGEYQSLATALSLGIGIGLLVLMQLYRKCGHFLLSHTQHRLLFGSTLVGLAVGYWVLSEIPSVLYLSIVPTYLQMAVALLLVACTMCLTTFLPAYLVVKRRDPVRACHEVCQGMLENY